MVVEVAVGAVKEEVEEAGVSLGLAGMLLLRRRLALTIVVAT